MTLINNDIATDPLRLAQTTAVFFADLFVHLTVPPKGLVAGRRFFSDTDCAHDAD
jgi:hypothetical protein